MKQYNNLLNSMTETDLINYFGEDILNGLLEFYKVGALTILVKHQVSIYNINIMLVYLKDIRRKGVRPNTIKNNCAFMSFIL
jgi:hypothetical protein